MKSLVEEFVEFIKIHSIVGSTNNFMTASICKRDAVTGEHMHLCKRSGYFIIPFSVFKIQFPIIFQNNPFFNIKLYQ